MDKQKIYLLAEFAVLPEFLDDVRATRHQNPLTFELLAKNCKRIAAGHVPLQEK